MADSSERRPDLAQVFEDLDLNILKFPDYAKEHQITDDKYPFANAALSLRRWKTALVWVAVVLALVAWGTGGLFAFLQSEEEGGMLIDPSLFRLTEVVSQILALCSGMAIGALVGSVIVYLLLVPLRWHSFERDCLRNDGEALSLRTKILDSMQVPRRISDLRKKQNSSNDSKLSREDEAKLSALMFLRRMRVNVNTRQSLDGDEVEKRYRVCIEVPSVQQDLDELQALIKEFDALATRVTEGVASFGSQVITKDQKHIQYFDAIVVPDRYTFEVVTDDGTVVVGEWQSTFPLDLFVDRQSEIDKKTDQAREWAARAASDVDDLMTTMGMAGKRTKMNVGAVNVTYEYQMSFKLDENNVDRLPDKLDKRFNASGTVVESHGNGLAVTVPIPAAMTCPINVPTLYRDAFGGASPAHSEDREAREKKAKGKGRRGRGK